MLMSQAYETWRAEQPMAMVRNVMQDKAQPYYYAMGASVVPRLNVTYRGMQIGGSVAALLVGSMDGHDRDQEMMNADAHMTDTDVRAQAWIGYQLGAMSVVLDGAATQRGGSMGSEHASTETRTAMLTVGYRR
jgi:hypothetical protein